MEKKELHELLNKLCKQAYVEGRQHQFDDDWPEVGMYFKKSFEDTKTFKMLKDNKERQAIERQVHSFIDWI